MFPPCLLLNPEALAPTGLCCPAHHRLATSSASLTLSNPFPATDGYRIGLWHSRIILPEHQTFRAFVAELSRIAAFNSAGSPTPAFPSFFGVGTGHQVVLPNPWLPNTPANQLHAGWRFRRLIRSLSLRPSCLLAPLDWSSLNLISSVPWGFYVWAFSYQVTQIAARYNYDAILGIASAGLAPASSATSLAAPGQQPVLDRRGLAGGILCAVNHAQRHL